MPRRTHHGHDMLSVVARLISDSDGIPTDAEDCSGIVGQPGGPRSWSEYWTGPGNEFDPSEQFHRRNVTPFRDDVPSLGELKDRR